MWPEGEIPRLLMPLASVEDKDLLHQIIDQHEQEFFKILKERYPEELEVSSLFSSACTLFPPSDLSTNAVLDQWVGNMLTLLENGNFSTEQQHQIVARHRANAQSKRSQWHQRTNRLIHPPDRDDRNEPRPLASYIERVISTLQIEYARVHELQVLGYNVSIADVSRPATIKDIGTNAKPNGNKNSQRQTTSTTSSKSTDTTTPRCVFCGNDPKAQVKFGINPPCDLTKRSCANFAHPDCNKSGATPFEESEIGKKYASLGKKRFIISAWRYDHATKKMIKTVNELDLHIIENRDTNEQMLLSSVQHFSEQRDKPSVILRLNDPYSDKHFETEVLIDPASYQNQTTSKDDTILSYVSKDLADQIKLHNYYALSSCDDLFGNSGNTTIIIGLSDVRKHDLTTVSKHMYKYVTENEHERKSNDPTNEPNDDHDQTTIRPLYNL